jgi:integrase
MFNVMKRRTKGQGSIRMRSDGRLEVRVMSDGRRRTRALPKGASRQLAEHVREELVTEVREGRLAGTSSETLAGYLRRWLAATAPRTLRPRSLERYTGVIERHVIPTAGHVRLNAFSEGHAASLHAAWAATVSSHTARYHHAVLRSAFREAVERRIIARNPMHGVHPPRRSRRPMQALSPSEARDLLDAARDDDLEALYVLAITTGLRQGELLGLTWRDVDLRHARVSVQRTLVRLRGRWIVAEPKSIRSCRTVALGQRAVAALSAQRRKQLEQHRQAASVWGAGDLVFTDAAGRPLLGAHVTERCLKPLLRRAGLPVVRFHDLRHTSATLLLSEGVHPKIVSEMLGHSSIELTLDTYSHVLPDMQDRVAAAMDDILQRANQVHGTNATNSKV